MKNRSCFFLFLFLALLGNTKKVFAQAAAALQVQVYDYAGLSPAALHELIARIQQILTSSGLSVEVDTCARGGEAPCESRSGSGRQVVIRIVSALPGEEKNSRWQHLGQSIAGHDGGTYATIFLHQVKDQAAEANLPWVVVLAYAAAHEVGHLLLGDQAHSARDLMKAHWEKDDFQAMAQSRLHFSSDQIQELKNRYGTARPIEVDADMAMAAQH